VPHKFLSILLLAILLCGCKEKSAKPVSSAPIERYPLDGVILELDQQGHIAKIKHQKIGSWMEAMTMEFPVKDPAEFKTLSVGEHVTGTVFVQDLNYWIGEVRQVR
jgi:Cu/Ag efflux protein CusF